MYYTYREKKKYMFFADHTFYQYNKSNIIKSNSDDIIRGDCGMEPDYGRLAPFMFWFSGSYKLMSSRGRVKIGIWMGI